MGQSVLRRKDFMSCAATPGCPTVCAMPETFKATIDLWGPSALGEDLDVDVERVRKWRQRNSIPGEFWLSMVEAAKRRGFKVTLLALATMAREGST